MGRRSSGRRHWYSMTAHTGLTRIIISVFVAHVARTTVALGQERVDTSYHLSGSHVVRYPRDSNVVEYRRVVLRGVKSGYGCGYHSGSLGQFRSEWVVESDDSACVEIRALGVRKNSFVFSPDAERRTQPFRLRT